VQTQFTHGIDIGIQGETCEKTTEDGYKARLLGHDSDQRIVLTRTVSDGHYARQEAMTWCENNGIDYILGLSGTKP